MEDAFHAVRPLQNHVQHAVNCGSLLVSLPFGRDAFLGAVSGRPPTHTVAVDEFVDLNGLCTLLELAVDDSFRRLCGDIADFLHDLSALMGDATGPSAAKHNAHAGVFHCECKAGEMLEPASVSTSQSGYTGVPVPAELEHNSQVLCLDRLLRPTHASHRTELRCGVETDMLALLAEGHSLWQLHQHVVQGPGLHEHTRVALQLTPVWDRVCQFSQVVLYTDGSYRPGVEAVGYAIVALVEVHGQWQFAGYYAGAVSFGPDDLGMPACAHIAELCGMIHARLIHIADSLCLPVTIRYDCESACQVMQCASPKGTPMGDIASHVAAICIQLRLEAAWQHVGGHTGDPWNELVDHLAKQCLAHHVRQDVPERDTVNEMLNGEWFPWMWMAIAAQSKPQCWPEASPEGHFISDTNTADRCQIGPFESAAQSGAAIQHALLINIATYNTLSLAVPGQIECLEEHFGRQGCHILGLQECRQDTKQVAQGNLFLRFASTSNQGRGGCQIWLSKTHHLGIDQNGDAIQWRSDTFVCHHSDSRCLAVSGKAGDIMFGLVSAHACTSSTDKDVLRHFWQSLACVVGKLPEDAIKIIMVDANATFDPNCRQDSFYRPLEDNAEAMCDMMSQTQMASSDLWDITGNQVHTWCSPSGFLKALDYIMVPRNMYPCLQTIGADTTLDDLFADMDHRPLLIKLTLNLCRPGQASKRPAFDVRAMETPSGQQRLRDIFARAPEVDWRAHASVHWNRLKQHLIQECMHWFPLQGRKPRKTYISDSVWMLIQRQRQLRGELRYRNQGADKWRCHLCFHAWKRLCVSCPNWLDDLQGRQASRNGWLRRHDVHVASLWQQLTHVRSEIKRLMKQCQAAQARTAFQDARTEGAGAISRLMTSLMQTGRRYRPPQVLPPIRGECGDTLTTEQDVFAVLGKHFATAEKAVCVDEAQYAEIFHCPVGAMPDVMDGCVVPSIANLAQAFRKIKARKAPGASGLSPEIFRTVANSAAMAMYPIFLKQLMRGEVPEDFLKSLISPIPKPGKDPTQALGWRSIALQEILTKAINSMMRKFLVQAMDRVASPLQLGGRPGGPIMVPSLHVQAHLRRMRRQRRSAGVLYIDGVQAFYSVVREIITGLDEGVEGASRVIAIIDGLSDDESVREDIFKLLCGPSILEQAGTPSFVRSFLRSQFRGSHFEMNRGAPIRYLTQAGTTPGAPLADILFQLALVYFHRKLHAELAQAGLLVSVHVPVTAGSDGQLAKSSTSTWVDDLAIAVHTDTASSLVPRIARVASLAEQILASTGVTVNYSVGKTEAMVCFRGKGASTVRKLWMIEQQGRVLIPFGPGKGKCLQLTSEYVHLGCRLQANGQQTSAICYRRSVAQPIFAALRKRLLYNPNLTKEEKIRLVVQGPLASFLHGSGLWVVAESHTRQRAFEFIGSVYRQCVRPLHQVSSRGLNTDEICSLLGVLPPELVLRNQRLRMSLSITALVDCYLAGVLAEEGLWMQMLIEDWQAFDNVPFPKWVRADGINYDMVWVLFQWLSSHRKSLTGQVNAWLKQHLRLLHQGSQRVLAKAHVLDHLHKLDAVSWRCTIVRDGSFSERSCPECHKIVCGAAALASHRRKVHGVLSLGALLQDHTICPVCMTEFWTPARLWLHLRKSDVCLQVFQAADLDLGPNVKPNPETATLPAVKVPGPQLWWTHLRPGSDLRPSEIDNGRSSVRQWIHQVWTRFQDTIGSSGDRAFRADAVRRVWQEVSQILHHSGSLPADVRPLCSDSDSLWALARACQGLSICKWGFLLCTFNDVGWVVPVEAKQTFAQLVQLCMENSARSDSS